MASGSAAFGDATSFTISPALSSQAVFSCSDFTASGSSNVIDSVGSGGGGVSGYFAHIVSNGNVTLSGTTTIYGNAVAGPGKAIGISGGAKVLGSQLRNASPLSCSPIDLTALAATLQAVNDDATIPPTAYGKSAVGGKTGADFSIGNGDSVTLAAGTYFFTSFTVGGGSTVAISGQVNILCTGKVSIGGGGQFNGTGNAYALRFWSSGNTFDLSNGNTLFSGFVYAPNARIGISGGSRLIGGVFGSSVTISGGSRITRSVDQSSALAVSFTEKGSTMVSGSVYGRAVSPLVVLTGGNLPRLTSLTLNGSPYSSGTSITAEGNFTLVAVADDAVGRHISSTATFVIDRTPPVLGNLNPPPGALLSSRQVVLTGTCSDAISVKANGSLATVAGGTFSVAFGLGEGANSVSLAATDAAGNTATETISWVVDSVPPVIAITSPKNGFVTKGPSVSVSGTVSDASVVSVTVNGTAALVSGGVFSSAAISVVEGSNSVTAIAMDAAGHASFPVSVTVFRDTQPPSIDILDGSASIPDGSLLNHDPAPVIAASDSHLQSVSATLNGAPFVSGTPVLQDGVYDLVATATDGVGNSARREVHFSVDTTPPALAITSPPVGSFLTSAAVSVSGACGDAARVTVNGAAASISNGRFQVDGLVLPEGQATITATAEDLAGNNAAPATISVTVDTLAPTISIGAPVDHAYVSRIPFSVTGTANDANLVSVTVNGAASQRGLDGSFVSAPVSPPDGPFSIVAVAADAAGHTANASESITIDTLAPKISVTNANAVLPDGALFTRSVTPVVTIDDANPGTMEVLVNGTPFPSGTIVAADGAYRLDVTAKDAAGNLSSLSLTFSIDTRPPKIGNLLPAAGSVLRDSAVTVSGSCDDAVSVTVNGTPASVAGGAFSVTGVTLTKGVNAIVIVAKDAAGNSASASLSLTLDTDPPDISIASPAADSLTKTGVIAVAGTVTDDHLSAVTVNNGPATVTGSTFSRTGVTLSEGANLIDAVATDAAGNAGEAKITVTLDTTPPLLAITSPVAGAIAGASPIDVSGTASDAHLRSVVVNGISATIVGSHFAASGVSLVTGANTLTATATDAAGNLATAVVSVSFDDRAPNVTIGTPGDGSRLNKQPITVSGTVEGGTGIALTVNGQPATVTGASYEATGIPLNEGPNTLTVRATNASGKQGVATAAVAFDDVAPAVQSMTPADGSYDVPLATVVRIVFSEPIDPASFSSGVSIAPDGAGPIAGKWTLDTATATFVPDAGLPGKTSLTATVSAAVADLAGNPLGVPFASHFRTGSPTAPPPPILDPLPRAVCASTIDVSGNTDPFLQIVVTGGAAVAAGTADVSGRFSVAAKLASNAQNVLSVVATDSQGRTSPPSGATVAADCIAPTVSDAAVNGPDVVVTFSETIDPTSAPLGTAISLAGAGGDLARSVSWSPDGVRATIAAGADLTKTRFTLTVTTDVRDPAGNPMAAVFTKTFSPGSSAILGEVYDDSIGRPLAGAAATLLAANGAPPSGDAAVSSSESDGRFTLDVPSGDLAISISRAGYSPVYRHEIADPDSALTTFDARLTALHPASADGEGGGVFVDGRLSLQLAQGSLPDAAPLEFAELSPQGLPALLPLGWTSIGAMFLDAGALAQPALATWSNEGWPTGTGAALVFFDTIALRWIVAEPSISLSIDGKRWTANVTGRGAWALVVADTEPTSPPIAIAGQPLLGVAAPSADPLLSAAVVPDPSAVLPPQTDVVTITLTSSSPVPSGYPVQALISEELTRLDGRVEEIPDFLSDFVVQRSAAGDQVVAFPIRPSDEAARVALSVGFEKIAVKHYPFEIRRGDLLPPSGGTVSGAGGFSVTVPGGAVSQAIPVTMTPLSNPGDLPVGVPAGYHLMSAVRLALGEVTLGQAALLRFTPADGSALPASAQYVWVEASAAAGGLVVRFVARGSFDPSTGSVSTMSPDPDLIVPGVREDGVYLLLSADAPVAFASGHVLDVDGRTLSGAIVSEQATSIVQITDGSGAYGLPFPSSGSILVSSRPETGNSGSVVAPASSPGAVMPLDVALVITAPFVVSVDPDIGRPLPLSSGIVITFSEPVDVLSIDPAAVTLTAGGLPIDGVIALSPSGEQVSFTPGTPLPSNVDVQLRAASTIRDRTGYGLVDATTGRPSDFVATFHTFDDTPPAGINPLLIFVGMPAGDPPAVTITGGAGSVCGACSVTAVDDTTQATSSTMADESGAFRLDLRAVASDSIYLVVRKSNGTQLRINPGPFRDDGGRTAIVGTSAGDYLTADLVRVTFPDGTFSGSTTIRVAALARGAAPAPTPSDALFVAGFQLDTGGIRANNAIDFGVPAPPGAQTGDQFFAAVPVEILGEIRYMVLDTARLDGSEVTTRPATAEQSAALHLNATPRRSKSSLHFRIRPQDVSAPGPAGDPKLSLPRISESSTVIILEMQKTYDFIAGLTGDASAIVTADSTPYVWFTPRAYEKNFFILPVPQGDDYQLSILDPATGFTRFQGTFSGPVDPKNVTRLPDAATAGPDTEPPRVIRLQPATALTFTPLAAGGIVAPSISYTFATDPSGTSRTLTITGAPGATPAGSRMTLADNGRSLSPSSASAGADGAFGVSIAGAQSGDDFTFVEGEANVDPAAAVHLEFSEALAPSQDLGSMIVLTTPSSSGKIPATLALDSDSRGVTLTPQADFVRGRPYTVTVLSGASGVKDGAGNALRSPIAIPLDSPPADPAGRQAVTDVNDLARTGGLLFEVTEDGTLGLYSAADPASLAPCNSVDFGGAALRGVAFDGYGRAIVSGGGGSVAGFVSVHRLLPASNPCGYSLSSNAIARTQIASAIGDEASSLPEGFPRRVRLISDDAVRTFVVDSGSPPAGIALEETNDPVHPGKQKPASPLSVTVLVGAGLRNHPVKVTNASSGEARLVYTDDSGSAAVTQTASSGDSFEVRSNASLLALVANQGFGMDVVDVNATDLTGSQSVLAENQRLLAEFDGTYSAPIGQYCGNDSMCPAGFVCHGSLSDIEDNYCYVPFCQERDGYGNCVESMSGLFDLTDLDVLTTDDGKVHVLTGINHFGLASWTLDFGDVDHPFHYESQLRIGSPLSGDQVLSLSTAPHLKLKSSSERSHCRPGQIGDAPSLAFVAESTAGFYVVDVSDPTRLSAQNVVGHYDTDGQAARFGIDTLHDLLYVADGGQGVKMYDISDPCTAGIANLADPRLVGTIATGGNANVPFVIDPEIGVAFGAAQNTSAASSTVFTFSLFPPPVNFVADTDRNGVWEQVNGTIPLGIPNAAKKAALGGGASHGPYPADTVRVLANVAGGAGPAIAVEVDSTNPEGFTLPPAPPGFPKEKNVVELRRESDDAADPAFNRYLSPPIVLLADPRAQAQYGATADEKDETNPTACANCAPAPDYGAELASLASGTSFGSVDASASGAVEQMTGDMLVVRLDTAQTDSGSLPAKLKYLGETDVESAVAMVDSVRMELTPSLAQSPAQNPSLLTTEAGIVVDTHNGATSFSATDLAIKGRGLDFSMNRTYVSDALYAGPFGRNFDSPLFARLRPLPSGDVDFYPGDGSRRTFRFGGGAFVAPPGVFADLFHPNADSYLLVLPDHSLLDFDGRGRLQRISDRNTTRVDGADGNAMKFSYDGAGRLASVLDPTNRPINFEWDGVTGRLVGLTDFVGRTIAYSYDSSARLGKIVGPDPGSASSKQPQTTQAWTEAAGDLKTRLYRDGELVSVTDGENRKVFAVGYANPAVADSLTFGGGVWRIGAPGTSTTITDPNENERTYSHDASGHATSVAVPGGATTSLTYDGEGRLTSITPPLEDSVSYAYAPASSDGSKRAMGNVLQVTQYPRRGSSEAQANQSRVTAVAYEGKTNQVVSYSAPATAPVSIVRDGSGNVLSVQNGSLATTLTYNSFGQVLTSNDTQSGQRTYTYEGSDPLRLGYLRSESTTAGTTEYFVDNRGNVTESIDPSLKAATYMVNALDQVEREERGSSSSSSTYDAAGNLEFRDVLTAVDAQGKAISSHTDFQVDEIGRMKARSDDGRQTTYAYDVAGNLINVDRPATPLVSYVYDARNRMKSMTVGTRTTSYVYDDDDARLSTTNARGKTTTFALNGFGENIGEVDPLGVTTTSKTDSAGRPTDTRVTKNGLLLKWTQTAYDPMGRVTSEIRKLFNDPLPIPPDGSDPVGATDVVSQTVYDDAGHSVTTVDPRGFRAITQTDSLGRLLKSTDAMGNTVEYAYETNGNKKGETTTELRPDGTKDQFTTAFEYDDQNRLTSVTDTSNPSAPLSTSYTYDPRGNKLTETDAEGHVTRYEYDLKGRRTKAILPQGMTTEFGHDDSDRLISVKDAEGNVTSYSYDPDGRPSAITWADGKSVIHGYDDSDNLIKSTDPNGTIINQTFDDNDRLVRKDFTRAAGVGGPDHEAFTLDDQGRVVSAENGATAVTLKYDSLDRTLIETLSKEGTSYPVLHDYDLAGNPISLTYPSERKVSFEYDPLNRINRILEGGSPIAIFGFAGMRPLVKTLGNNLVETVSYDQNRRIADIAQGLPGISPVEHLTYAWTPTRRKTSAGRTSLGTASVFGYDGALRLIQENMGVPLANPRGTPSATVAYSLDGVDKIEAITDSRVGIVNSSFDDRQRVTSLAGQTYSYDPAGNMAQKSGGDTMTYDAENRLIEVRHADGSKDAFAYDALGRRVARSITIGSMTLKTTEVESGYEVISEYKGVQLDREYVWGNGTDELVQVERDADGDGVLDQTLYPLQDTQASITALTDVSGAPVERYSYEAYGRTSILTPDASPRTFSLFGNSYLWQGRPWTGGYGYFRARYFDPSSRTWTTPDPLSYSSPVANLYAGFNLDGGINSLDSNGLTALTTAFDRETRTATHASTASFVSELRDEAFDALLDQQEGNAVDTVPIAAAWRNTFRRHVFINGIANDQSKATASAETIAKAFPGEAVDVVHNPSSTAPLDTIQAYLDSWGIMTNSNYVLRQTIETSLALIPRSWRSTQPSYVVLHAHSQGGLIAAGTIDNLMSSAERRRMVLVTYGGAQNKVEHHADLRRYIAFATATDPVPIIAGFGILDQIAEAEFHFLRPSIVNAKPGSVLRGLVRSHNFIDTYSTALSQVKALLDGY